MKKETKNMLFYALFAGMAIGALLWMAAHTGNGHEHAHATIAYGHAV